MLTWFLRFIAAVNELSITIYFTKLWQLKLTMTKNTDILLKLDCYNLAATCIKIATKSLMLQFILLSFLLMTLSFLFYFKLYHNVCSHAIIVVVFQFIIITIDVMTLCFVEVFTYMYYLCTGFASFYHLTCLYHDFYMETNIYCDRAIWQNKLEN